MARVEKSEASKDDAQSFWPTEWRRKRSVQERYQDKEGSFVACVQNIDRQRKPTIN